jgi:predicted lipase
VLGERDMLPEQILVILDQKGKIVALSNGLKYSNNSKKVFSYVEIAYIVAECLFLTYNSSKKLKETAPLFDQFYNTSRQLHNTRTMKKPESQASTRLRTSVFHTIQMRASTAAEPPV